MKAIAPVIAGCAAAVLTLSACGGDGGTSAGEATAADGGLPDELVISTYGVGTGTYADVAAMAEGLTKGEGTNIRIIPSDTGIGRIQPLTNEQALFSRSGEEYIYAFEGDDEFADEEWGPQDLEVAWAIPTAVGFAVQDGSDIQSFEDLRGKKVPKIIANPSGQAKMNAALAYGGLTYDDVQTVELGYGELPDAMKSGKIDVLVGVVYGANLFELDSSNPLRWLSMDDDSPEKLDAVHEYGKSLTPGPFSNAPGQEDGETANGLIYPLPIITYADTDPAVVHGLVEAIDANYDGFKDVTESTEWWNTENVIKVPSEVPFHPGTITYLEEQGEWTEEAAAVNDELVQRGEDLRAGWDEFLPSADGTDLPAEWEAWKEENVPSD